MALLDDSLKCSTDADAVATHDNGLFLKLVVLVYGLESICILGAELEDLPHFNTALDGDGLAAHGASVARCRHHEVGVIGLGD